MLNIVRHLGNAIKTTRQYQFTHKRFAIITKTNKNKYWQKYGDTETLIHLPLGM